MLIAILVIISTFIPSVLGIGDIGKSVEDSLLFLMSNLKDP